MADEDDFQPRIGKMRSGGGERARRYLGRVLAAANLAGVGRNRSGQARSFSGARIGRAAGTGRMLAARSAGARRVIVKTSIVKLAGKGAAGAMAHLRYLQRDGTTREGEAGMLYDRDGDAVEARDFHARCGDDRHQFRFIVSPEDGDQLGDLKLLTRRLMERVEQDLGTRLEWVAVDHYNTGHPHSHIVLRGVDDRGKDLVIARDYLTRGLRERAAELVDLDLGPPTEREVEARLRREVGDERLTSIDRALLRDADAALEVHAAAGDPFVQTLRAGRLAKLSRMGLADHIHGDRYQLAQDLEATLRRMGERGDIIRTLQRTFAEQAIERPQVDQTIFDPARDTSATLVGRVLARGLSDEQTDRHFIVVDGLDGRTHFVDIGRGRDTEPLSEHAIVAVTPRPAGAGAADRTIAEVAARNRGRYDVDAHFNDDPAASEDHVAAHVRRLEAARRGGVGVERSPSGEWLIPPNYVEQVERWQANVARNRPVEIEILASHPIEQLAHAEAATWLDRDLVSPSPSMPRDAGFGSEVVSARAQRRQWLVDQGLAEFEGEGIRYRRNLVAILQRRELVQAGERLSRELGLPFEESRSGERIDGVFRRRVDLISGRFALVERAHDFTLVPWRPTLDRALGKPVSGLVRDAGVSWTIGRSRQGPAIN